MQFQDRQTVWEGRLSYGSEPGFAALRTALMQVREEDSDSEGEELEGSDSDE